LYVIIYEGNMASKQELEAELIEKNRLISELEKSITQGSVGTVTSTLPDGKLEVLQVEYNKLLEQNKRTVIANGDLVIQTRKLKSEYEKSSLKIDELESDIGKLRVANADSIGESITAIEVYRLIHTRNMDEGQILFIKKD